MKTPRPRRHPADDLPDATDHGPLIEAPDPLPRARHERPADAPARQGHHRAQEPAGTTPDAGAGTLDTPLGVVIESTVKQASIATGGVGVSYGSTFKLHSLPTSSYKIYLDFDGHTTSGTAWNGAWGRSSFTSPAFSLDAASSFNAAELDAVQKIWQGMADAFSPFNIDVTTEDPGTAALAWSGAGDAAHGIRVVITDEMGKNYGGIAYLGSFSWSTATPAFVYANMLGDSVKTIVAAAAHEVGHTLGLTHDGRGTAEYDYGHGSGATSWAPVMGAAYYTNVMQWSAGGYAGATNAQDDLTIITTANQGVTWRTDDAGDSFATAATLAGTAAGGIFTVSTFGVISGSGARNDVDVYAMRVAAGGSIDLAVAPMSRAYVTGSATPVYAAATSGMLDVKLTLQNAAGTVIATADDPTRQDASLSVSGLAAGTYYLTVDGTGWGSPTGSPASGWSEYGSLGQYGITGRYSLAPPPVLQVSKATLATTETGGADSVVVRALGAIEALTVTVGGLDATEGLLSATSLVLNAANNWTATLGVTGLNDRDIDGAQKYTLALSAPGAATVSLAVTNADDDRAAAAVGAAPTLTGATKPSATSATLANLATDNGTAMKITEGLFGGSAYAEWRWQFARLPGGDMQVQIDASSAGEAFRFEYSTDNAGTWQAFAGGADATRWNGDYLAAGAGTTLWVRLVDALRSADAVRDAFLVDLLTVAPVPATLEAPGAITTDHPLA